MWGANYVCQEIQGSPELVMIKLKSEGLIEPAQAEKGEEEVPQSEK